MLIENKKYIEILNKGLLLDHYFLLCSIRDRVEILNHPRIIGFLNVLRKHKFIDNNNNITELGKILVGNSITKNSSIEEIYKKCQEKLLELTGKKQVSDTIKNKKYYFFPNFIDFEKNIKKIIKIYNIDNIEKLENTLIKYIINCNNSRSWFPVLQYYIYKDNHSKLVTDMSAEDEEDNQDYKSSQKLV